MAEQPLPGGAVTAVTRAGNTVRRTPPPDPAFVHALLRLFERRGWDGAPRFLGTDERGREVLSYLHGHVPWQPAQPPDARIHDLAHVCWQYVGLGPGIADPTAAGERMRLICDAYGLGDTGQLVDAVLWWQDRCWHGILAKAEAGEPAMIRLRDSGAADSVRREFDWVTRHRDELAAPLR